MPNRAKGITCMGTWIIDHIRMVDVWPQEETLANILGETSSGGGLAYNVSVDLARFNLGIPLEGAGFVGDDEDGGRILADCDRYGIGRKLIRVTRDAPTSYTEVITVQSTGRRTFFHSQGANRLLKYETVPFNDISTRIVHFGYILVLAGVDAPDPEFGTVAAKILRRLQQAGVKTSVDVTSEDSDRFLKLVPPALKYADYVILNEIEAGRTTGHRILNGDTLDPKALRACARRLLEMGSTELVCIHMHIGGYALTRDGREVFQPSFDLPAGCIKGTAGAGDAFCAGILAGIHEGWDLGRSLRFGVGAAASCLSDPTTTEGVKTAEEIWRLFDKHPLRKPGM